MILIGHIKDIWRDEQGLTSVEYALLLSLVFLGSLGAWSTLGGEKMRMTTEAVTKYMGE